MKSFFKCFVIAFFAIVFVSCKEDVSESAISSGAKSSDEHKELEQNLDKNSYLEILDVVGDNKEIKFDKEVLLIFGRNGCTYCDILKKEIQKDSSLKEKLKNFNVYYINTSYVKNHDIILGSRSTLKSQALAYIFNVNTTPNLIFLFKDGSVKYIYPGYTPKLHALIDNVIAKKEAMGDYKEINAVFSKARIVDSKQTNYQESKKQESE